jgi:hypothetical protein
VVFTAGIGENSPFIRARACEGLEPLGIGVDAKRNQAAIGRETDITGDGMRTKVLVVPTNEELAIARDTRRILEQMGEAKPVTPAEPEAKTPGEFRSEETGTLVLAWARNPAADFAALAAELSRSLKRTVDADAVERELRRLCLVRGRPAKKKSGKLQ